MPRAGGVLLLAAAAAGALAVLLAAAFDERPVAFSVGVPGRDEVVTLAPGKQACRAGIDVPAVFDRVGLLPAEPGAAVAVRVRRRAAPGHRVTVCARNMGRRWTTLLGASPDVELAGLGLGPRAELGVVFLREDPPSMLSLVPDAFERAALFKAGWVGAWTFWALLGLIALGLPLLLLRAYRSTGAG